jgi:transcriptional regulator with XRE-family HTH domain
MNVKSKGFGKKLKKLRAAAGLTQAALGAKVGVHPVSIAQYELGVCHPSEKSAAKIMAFFEGKPEKATPADPPAPKKRGRPRKIKPAGPPETPPAEDAPDKEPPQKERASNPAGRLSIVDRAWFDQQIESHVHTCGFLVREGPVCLIVLKRVDLDALCRLMLRVAGTQIRGETP